MRLNVLAFKNTKLGCFTNPHFDDHEVELCVTQLTRSLKICNADIAKSYIGLELYWLGVFDDETGCIINNECKLLLDCNPVLVNRGDIKFAEVELEDEVR